MMPVMVKAGWGAERGDSRHTHLTIVGEKKVRGEIDAYLSMTSQIKTL